MGVKFPVLQQQKEGTEHKGLKSIPRNNIA